MRYSIYKKEQDLPPLATPTEILRIRSACQKNKVHLGRSAQSNLHHWKIHESQLRGAIIGHIESGRRIFRKFQRELKGVLLEGNRHANVTLYVEKDIYVEMILMAHERIIINAHDHDKNILLLPQ
jgi:hypothetical protein